MFVISLRYINDIVFFMDENINFLVMLDVLKNNLVYVIYDGLGNCIYVFDSFMVILGYFKGFLFVFSYC